MLFQYHCRQFRLDTDQHRLSTFGLGQTKPDITILTIGANDAMRGIEVATIENNIRTAIKRLQAAKSFGRHADL